jgi:myosin-crossreactive antigen
MFSTTEAEHARVLFERKLLEAQRRLIEVINQDIDCKALTSGGETLAKKLKLKVIERAL